MSVSGPEKSPSEGPLSRTKIFLIVALFVLLFAVSLYRMKVLSSPKNVHIISFPKSGRTWLRFMLGYVFSKHFAVPADTKEIFHLKDLSIYDSRIPQFHLGHRKSNLEAEADYEKWKLPHFDRFNVLFLIRDPRDVLVSNYFQKAHRNPKCEYARKLGINPGEKDKHGPGYKMCHTGLITDPATHEQKESEVCSCFPKSFTMRDLLYEPRGGFTALLNYDAKFYKAARKRARSFLLVKYEDLHDNAARELKRIAEFAGVSNIHPDVFKEAAEAGSFQNMRSLEMSQQIGGKLSPKDDHNLETFKTREGKVGNYVAYFSPEDIEWMENQMKAILPLELSEPYLRNLGALAADAEADDIIL